jgi:hypothetical protein
LIEKGERECVLGGKLKNVKGFEQMEIAGWLIPWRTCHHPHPCASRDARPELQFFFGI